MQQEFVVTDMDGLEIGVWTLVSIESLPRLEAAELEHLDCFLLVFDCSQTGPREQGYYRVMTGDFGSELFMAPESPTRMLVTVN